MFYPPPIGRRNQLLCMPSAEQTSLTALREPFSQLDSRKNAAEDADAVHKEVTAVART